MIDKLVIKKKHIEKLKEITESALPLEACALLIGIVNDNNAIIEEIRLLKNIANSDIMFIIDPDEFYDAYKKVRDEGREIICIFHSHPTKPKPSQTDLRYMMINQIPWLIMSNIDYTLNAYIYHDNLKKLELVLDPS